MEPGQSGSWQDHDSERAYPGRKPVPGALARCVSCRSSSTFFLLFFLTAARWMPFWVAVVRAGFVQYPLSAWD